MSIDSFEHRVQSMDYSEMLKEFVSSNQQITLRAHDLLVSQTPDPSHMFQSPGRLLEMVGLPKMEPE